MDEHGRRYIALVTPSDPFPDVPLAASNLMTNAESVSRPYQICANCIMDTSSSLIEFDERGWCEYCNNCYASILQLPKRSYRVYRNKMAVLNLGTGLLRAVGALRAIVR